MVVVEDNLQQVNPSSPPVVSTKQTESNAKSIDHQSIDKQSNVIEPSESVSNGNNGHVNTDANTDDLAQTQSTGSVVNVEQTPPTITDQLSPICESNQSNAGDLLIDLVEEKTADDKNNTEVSVEQSTNGQSQVITGDLLGDLSTSENVQLSQVLEKADTSLIEPNILDNEPAEQSNHAQDAQANDHHHDDHQNQVSAESNVVETKADQPALETEQLDIVEQSEQAEIEQAKSAVHPTKEETPLINMDSEVKTEVSTEVPPVESKSEEHQTEQVEPKQEEVQAEEIKPLEIKPEEIERKQEVPIEETKPEEPKTEEVQVNENKQEEPKLEEPKVNEIKLEESKQDEHKAEDIKPEESKLEEIITEESKPEEAKVEVPTMEEPKLVEKEEIQQEQVKPQQAQQSQQEDNKPTESGPEETTVEETKEEEAKQEEAKQEETKPEETKADEVQVFKTEEPKPVEIKLEESKPEEAKQEEELKPQQSQQEKTKVEEAKPTESKQEEAKVETKDTENIKAEDIKQEETKQEASKDSESTAEQVQASENAQTKQEPKTTETTSEQVQEQPVVSKESIVSTQESEPVDTVQPSSNETPEEQIVQSKSPLDVAQTAVPTLQTVALDNSNEHEPEVQCKHESNKQTESQADNEGKPEEQNIRCAKCIFCKIIAKEMPGDILYEDQDIVVIKDIKPVAKHHYLVIPRHHIANVKCLKKEDIEFVNKLKSIGTQVLEQQLKGEDASKIIAEQSRFGFHWPFFSSVAHLHLHVIAPVSDMSWKSKLVFKNNSLWFTSFDAYIAWLSAK